MPSVKRRKHPWLAVFRADEWEDPVEVRRIVLSMLALLAMFVGADMTLEGLEGRARDEAARERRLDPSAPLIRVADHDAANRGAHLARLRIPSIEIDEIVVEGVSARELAVGAGRYPTSAPIGTSGATAIAGHRTGWGDPFLRLDELDRGDTIALVTRGTRFVYRVTRSIVVDPDDRWVLDGDPRSDSAQQLVLTTCTPIYTARDRLIVFSALVRATAT
jgi:sortase A